MTFANSYRPVQLLYKLTFKQILVNSRLLHTNPKFMPRVVPRREKVDPIGLFGVTGGGSDEPRKSDAQALWKLGVVGNVIVPSVHVIAKDIVDDVVEWRVHLLRARDARVAEAVDVARPRIDGEGKPDGRRMKRKQRMTWRQ